MRVMTDLWDERGLKTIEKGWRVTPSAPWGHPGQCSLTKVIQVVET